MVRDYAFWVYAAIALMYVGAASFRSSDLQSSVSTFFCQSDDFVEIKHFAALAVDFCLMVHFVRQYLQCS